MIYTAPLKREVEFRRGASWDQMLHTKPNGVGTNDLPRRIADMIIDAIRADNDGIEDLPVCCGCALTALTNAVNVLLVRGHATFAEAGAAARAVNSAMTGLERKAGVASIMGVGDELMVKPGRVVEFRYADA